MRHQFEAVDIPDVGRISQRMRGRYARATGGLYKFGNSSAELPLLAALAAIETCTRLERYLPIIVSDCRRFALEHEQRPREPWPAAPGASRQTMQWTRWPEDALRRCAARDALPLLALAQDEKTPDRALAVDLIDQSLDLDKGTAAVRIFCDVENDMLSVSVDCGETDAWSQACDAVAELYAEILHDLLTDANVALADAKGIGSASLDAVLGPLSGQAVNYGAFCAIPQMLEESVDRHPDRSACWFGERMLTYRALDEKANGLAAQLAQRGVRRGMVVPVLLSNSLEMPVAYFALMKLGAAFVPLDPDWPRERLQQTLELLASPLILCTEPQVVPDTFRAQALAIDVERLPSSPLRPGVGISPEDTIYGIFTSGTTGRAKCAMNNHRGLSNRFRFMSRYFHEGRGVERILQNSKHTFDSSVWQLFWPLTTGGMTVIPRQGAFLDLEQIVETIARHRIAMTDFVPSVFNQLVALAEHNGEIREKLSTLRELVVGGEEITPQMVHKLRAILPSLRVTNAYGPTETSIGMVFHPVATADGMAIPLGRPIDNCHVVVVDAALKPLPPGACGELLIGGACVGSGYLHDARKTAAVFIDNPFPSVPGDKLYRTGDLGYFDPMGRLRFVGRRDFQVKVAGVRIELGEIEAAAERCPQVRHAKALVASAAVGKALALFATGDADLDEATLERHLHTLLPRHSVPRHLFILPAMPLTDNGKVDRQALQAQLDRRLDLQRADSDAASTGNALLDQVLRLFRMTLERPQLRPEDHFFESGGDSLLAVATAIALERQHGVRFTVKELLDHPSAGLAAARLEVLRDARPATDSDETVMDRDALLAPSWVTVHAAAQRIADAPRTVFVTGATGFVGSHLVHALLARGDVEVHALCRAEGDAQRHLVDALTRMGLWEPRFEGRLHAVRGSLAHPSLALDATTWHFLAHACDAIVHCGALVNFLYDYRAHRTVNVLATQELLRLSLAGRVKPLHHISTLGTLDREAALHAAPLDEDFDLAQAIRPVTGYSRSKWVAERLLLAARAQGAMVSIYRLGEVMPGTAKGLANPQALTNFLLLAFAYLGACPNVAIVSDWSPADYVAQRVVAAMHLPRTWNRSYHVIHPESVSFTQVFARAGVRLNTLSCRNWLQALDTAIADGGPRELTLLRTLLPACGNDEAELARALQGLLSDNPRLFARTQCAALEQALELKDHDLDAAIGVSIRNLRARHLRAG